MISAYHCIVFELVCVEQQPWWIDVLRFAAWQPLLYEVMRTNQIMLGSWYFGGNDTEGKGVRQLAVPQGHVSSGQVIVRPGGCELSASYLQAGEL